MEGARKEYFGIVCRQRCMDRITKVDFSRTYNNPWISIYGINIDIFCIKIVKKNLEYPWHLIFVFKYFRIIYSMILIRSCFMIFQKSLHPEENKERPTSPLLLTSDRLSCQVTSLRNSELSTPLDLSLSEKTTKYSSLEVDEIKLDIKGISKTYIIAMMNSTKKIVK